MQKLIFSLFILLIFKTAMGQNSTITGFVKDGLDQKPIEFATVTLLTEVDSQLVNGTISNSTGLFEINDINNGKYLLRVNFIGYEPLFESVSIQERKSTVVLEDINLLSSGELDAIEVDADLSPFETKIDRKIFNADENLSANGGTGIDLMRQIPTISIDENGNVQMRGDANVTILIDGRPSAMSPSQFLAQIPASAIEKVELITNPSAKYDPEGLGGIINVVLKKSKLRGFNGNITTSAGYGKFPKYSGALGLNYRNSKINSYINYSYDWRRTFYGGFQNRDVLLTDSTWDRLRQIDEGERINISNNIRGGADLFINDFNTIYLSANFSLGNNLGSRIVDYSGVDSDEIQNSFSQRNGKIDVPSINNSYTAGWQKSFKKEGHTLDLDFNYSVASMIADERLYHDYYGPDDEVDFTTYQNTLDDNSFINSRTRLDYVFPITDSLQLEAGFHYTYRESNNDFGSESAGPDKNFTEDITISNQFNYLQNTYAPYVILGRQWKRIGAQIGLRLEQTMTDAKLINTNEVFENDYLKLFPSAHLSYKSKNNVELQLSYSKRINRPSSGQLNPFSNYSDPLTLQTGNPFLRPEIIHVNELSVQKIWKKFNLNTTIYYRYITDLVRRQLTYEEEYSVVSYTNLGTSHLSGGDIILTYRPVKGMRIMSSTSVYITSTQDQELTGGELVHYAGANSSLFVTYQFKSSWTFQLWGSYSPVHNVIQGRILPNYGMGGAIQKSFLKDKLTLGLRFSDVFYNRQFTFESYDLGGYTFTSQRKWESRSVFFTATYNFGKMTRGKQRRSGVSEDSSDQRSAPELQ